MNSLDNILTFIHKRKMSVRQFEAEAGLSNGTINDNKKRSVDLSAKNIEKISMRFKEELIAEGFCILDLGSFGRPGELAVVNERERPAEMIKENESISVALEPSPMQILDRLSKAFVDQAEGFRSQARALADQAEGFKAQAEAFKSQGELMALIRKEMARADAQAQLDVNLIQTLATAEVVASDTEIIRKEILRLSALLGGEKTDPSEGAGTKSRQSDAAG